MFDHDDDPDLSDAYAPPGAPTTWTRAREDYLAGESASTVCERYRITRSTFFARAKAEGWRRSDAERAAPDPYVAEMEAALAFDLMARDATPAYVLARRAWAMAEIALTNRRRVEAQGWIRIARDLRRLVMEETGALTWTRAAQVGETQRAEAKVAARHGPLAGPPETEEEAFGEGGGGLGAPSGGSACTDAPGFLEPAPETKARQAAPPAPTWGPLPLRVLASPRRLNAFLTGEFAEAWAAADSPDRSDRTADSSPTSPAQAGAQVEKRSGEAVFPRPPAPTWAPACAGEVGKGR